MTMKPVNIKEYNSVKLPRYHWIPDRIDTRDHIFSLNAVKAKLPASVDLRPLCSPIEDQGSLGSCTAQTIAALMEFNYRKIGVSIDVSRMFIYYQERLLEGTVSTDNGATLRSGIKVGYTYGTPLESLWPYNPANLKIKPPAAVYKDGLKRKVTSYQRCTDFTAVKTALASGYPVTMGFLVYSSFEGSWNYIPSGQNGSGVMPYPNVGSEQLLGGHAVAVVGYNDVTQRFIVRNSWGTSWGDRGYFYMPYQVVENTSMSMDFWTINAVEKS